MRTDSRYAGTAAALPPAEAIGAGGAVCTCTSEIDSTVPRPARYVGAAGTGTVVFGAAGGTTMGALPLAGELGLWAMHTAGNAMARAARILVMGVSFLGHSKRCTR